MSKKILSTISGLAAFLVSSIGIYQFINVEHFELFEYTETTTNACGIFRDGEPGMDNYLENSFKTPAFLEKLSELDGKTIKLQGMDVNWGTLWSAYETEEEGEFEANTLCASAAEHEYCDANQGICMHKLYFPDHAFTGSFDGDYFYSLLFPPGDRNWYRVDDIDGGVSRIEGLVDVMVSDIEGFVTIDLKPRDPSENSYLTEKYECTNEIAELGEFWGKVSCIF